jgi:hypothetical protein
MSFWHQFWVTFFAWPGGGVWSNLLASILWVPFTLIHFNKRAKRHEASLAALHRKHDAMITLLTKGNKRV